MKITDRLNSLTAEQLKLAREWCAECADCGLFCDVDAYDVMNSSVVSDREIVAHVARNYDGGWAAFLSSIETVGA
jgi:hypothetical protein